jgi:CBS domain-containing protein
MLQPAAGSIAVRVGAGGSIRPVARLIARQSSDGLPVVDGDGTLFGIVTRVDALKALAR